MSVLHVVNLTFLEINKLGQTMATIKQDGGDGVGTNGAGGWWGLGGVLFPRLETLESKVGGAYISTRGKKFFSLFNGELGIIVYYGLIKTQGIVLMYNVN